MKESTIQSQIIEYLTIKNFVVIRLNGGRKGHVAFNRWITKQSKSKSRGAADILALSPQGQLLAIECKQPGRQARAEQGSFLTAINANNGIGIVADCVETVQQVVNFMEC